MWLLPYAHTLNKDDPSRFLASLAYQLTKGGLLFRDFG